MEKNVSCVIPVYNEEETVADMVRLGDSQEAVFTHVLFIILVDKNPAP